MSIILLSARHSYKHILFLKVFFQIVDIKSMAYENFLTEKSEEAIPNNNADIQNFVILIYI